jgi:peptidoglycan/LPS O-acetylase OafA/YrhL
MPLNLREPLSTTTPSRHIPSLDGIRALCVAMVLGGHVVLHGKPSGEVSAGDYFFNGNLGVRIFFVLSGFLITYLMVREEQSAGRIDLKRFYARRALRIVPVCYAFVAVFALLDGFTALNGTTCGYVTSLTYTKNFGCWQWADGHLWSLAVEEQFYLLWPFLMVYLPKRWRFGVMMGAILAAPLFRVAFKMAELPWYSQQWFAPTMDSLMIGACAGVLLAESPAQVARLVRMRPTLGRALALCVLYLPWLLKLQREAGWFTVPFGPTVQALAGMYLILSYALVEEGAGYRLLNMRLLREIGVLSYSLYIWQQLFIAPSGTYGAADPILTLFPYNLAATFLAAWLSYRFFEMPLLSLRERLRGPPHATHPAEPKPGAAIPAAG